MTLKVKDIRVLLERLKESMNCYVVSDYIIVLSLFKILSTLNDKVIVTEFGQICLSIIVFAK